MKTFWIIFGAALLLAKPAYDSLKAASDKADDLTALKKKVAAYDRYRYLHRKNIITLVKIIGKKKLITITNDEYPDETEYIYKLLKDTSGHVILTEQCPYSQSGDWYEEFKDYYNTNGKIFAFSKRETVFDESVNGGVAVQTDFRYYGRNFKVITHISKLTDKNGRMLKRRSNEFNFRDDKYMIYPNLIEYLRAYQIKI